MQLAKLIDLAASVAGSEYKVAKNFGIPQSHISEWKNGKRTCTAEDRALLADMAGVDPIPEIAEALLERVAGKPKEARLRDVLKNRLKPVGNFYVSLRRLAALCQPTPTKPVGNA